MKRAKKKQILVLECRCGNKRVLDVFIPNFQCEVCRFKGRRLDRIDFSFTSESKIRLPTKSRGFLPYQDGKGSFRPWLRFGEVKENVLKVDYESYLKTALWAEKKRQTLAERGSSCEACGLKERIHIHHATYSRLGNEDISDLRVLCENCHFELHKAHDQSKLARKRWKSLEKFTNRFIRKRNRKC